MTIDPQRLNELFLNAAEIASPAEQAAFLERECGTDVELRRRLEALLRARNGAGDFLAPPAEDQDLTTDPAPEGGSEEVGTFIGPYKLLQKLGEGGMGTVWVAEQRQPVKRRVALKVIKPGMDSAQVIRRFEAERQALALMDHTHIAKVFDAGTTPAGRPYFVMELVHGVPITKYCDELNLPIRERLALFVPVCQAIQHAHQKGIIHRDIKPSNVLVCMQDGRPVPKVIDFGVAKAMTQRLTEGTLDTAFGAVIGTLEYMAPEQAEMSPLGVDTRADVYALGVLLYELLTGTTPLDRKRLKQAALAEALRLIREEEPSKPSTRLTESQATLTDVAARRRIAPAQLRKALRGELDWITMKCLEKDRTRRYETASGLARDVERYLADEPVSAGPPGVSYQLRKVVRRHRGKVLAVGMMLGLLVAGVVASTWQAVRATWAEQATGQALAQVTEEQRKTRAALTAETAAKEQARRAQADAQTQQHEAQRRELLARHYWYGADMNLAQQSFDSGNGLRLLAALKRQIPRPGQDDLRGFEWWYLWRQSHTEKMTLAGHTKPVDHLAYSPDGKRLATAAGQEIKVWEAATGREIGTLSLGPDPCSALAFSPDGLALAVGVRPQDPAAEKALPRVQTWDVATRRKTSEFELGSGTVDALAFSSDGKTLTIVEYDIPIGQLSKSLSFSGFAKFIEKSEVMGLQVWSWDLDRGRGKPISLESTRRQISFPWGVALAGDRKTLVAAGAAHPPGWLLASLRGDLAKISTEMESMVCWWDLTTGRLKKIYHRPMNLRLPAAFSRDASIVASWGSDEKIMLLNAGSEEEQVLPGIRRYFNPFNSSIKPVFSRDGKALAFTSDPVTVQIWDVAAARKGATLRACEQPIQCLSFAPDGQTLAAGGRDQTVRIWDITGPTVPTVLLPKGPPPASPIGPNQFVVPAAPVLTLTRSGEALVTARGDTLQVWDIATGREGVALKDFVGPTLPPRLPDFSGTLIAASPDGKLVAALWNSKVKVWDLVTGELRAQILPDRGQISFSPFLGFTPDGRSLMGANRAWDATTWKERREPPPESLADIKAMSPDGKTFITVKVQWKNKLEFKVEDRVSVLALHDAESGVARYTLEFPKKYISSAAFTSDGRHIAVNFLFGSSTGLYDVSNGKELAMVSGMWKGSSADGRLAATADPEGLIRLWNTDTATEHATLQGHTQAISGIAFSPDGRTVASSCSDGTVKLWDPLTGQERLTFRHEGRNPQQIAFTPDGATLVVAWSGRLHPPNPGVVTLYRAAHRKEK